MIIADNFETGESVTIELADYTDTQLAAAVIAGEEGAADELRRRVESTEES